MKFSFVFEKYIKVLLSSPNKKLLIFLFFLLIAVFDVRTILSEPGVITLYAEWNTPPYSMQNRELFESDLYSWKSNWDFGAWNSSPKGLYYNFFVYILSFLMSGEGISKFLVVLAIFLSGGSMFLLCKQLKLGELSSFIGGIFYMFTPYLFNRISIGHLSIALNYSLNPIVLLLFMKSFKIKNNMKILVTAGLVLILATSHIANFALMSGALLTYCFVIIMLERNLYTAKMAAKNLSIVLLIPFIIHGYYLDILNEVTSNTVSAYLGFVPIKFISSEGFNLIDTVRIIAAGIPDFSRVAYGWSLWKIISFLPAFIAFSAIILKPKDKNVVFFGILAIVSITIASGMKGPLGNLWLWLLESFSPLRIFREPSHWMAMTSLAYAGLIGICSEEIIKNLHNNLEKFFSTKYHSLTKTVCSFTVLLAFLSVILSFGWPFLTGNFGGSLETYEFDPTYHKIYDWLSDDPEDYRVLMLPAPYPTTYEDQKRHRSANDVMSLFPGKPTIYTGKIYGPQFEIILFKSFYEAHTNQLGQLLGLANAKYIIYDSNKRSISTNNTWVNDYYPDMRFTNEKIEKTLKYQKDIELLEANSSIKVFLNNKYREHVFPLDRAAIVAGDLDVFYAINKLNPNYTNDTALIFLNQLNEDDLSFLLNLSNTEIIIQEGHYYDLVLATVSGKKVFRGVEYVNEKSPLNGWALMNFNWYRWSYLSQLDRVVFTYVPSAFTIPIEINESNDYDFYLVSYYSNESSWIRVFYDESLIGNVSTKVSNEEGFKLTYIGSQYLKPGAGNIKIESGTGENAITNLIIVPKNNIKKSKKVVAEILAKKKITLISKFYDSKNINPYGDGSYVLYPNLPKNDIDTSSKKGHGIPIYTSIHIPKEGYYNISILGASDINESSGVLVYNLNTSFELRGKLEFVKDNGLQNTYIGEMYFPEGMNILSVNAFGKGVIYLDRMAISSSKNTYLSESTYFTHKKINPTKYVINSNSPHPFFIFFSEAYNPEWNVHLANGDIVNHYQGFSFGNLFYIDRPGESQMSLEFDRQKLFNIHMYLSFILTLFLILYLFIWRE